MEREEQLLKELVERVLAGANNKYAATSALSILFPSVEKLTETFLGDRYPNTQEARRKRRISDRSSATSYFALSPTPDRWTKQETNQLLNGNPAVEFPAILSRIQKSDPKHRENLRRTLLEDLMGAFEDRATFTEEWLRAIVDVSPYFIQTDTDRRAFSLNNLSRLRIIVHDGIRHWTPEKRTAEFLNCVSDTPDLTLLCEVVRSIEGDARADGASEDRQPDLSFGEGKHRVRAALIGAIRGLVRNGGLWGQADPKVVLWFWWGSSEPGETQEFAAQQMNHVEGVVGLARAVTGTTISSDRGAYSSINETGVQLLLDLDELRSNAQRLLDRKRLSPEHRIVLEQFLGADVRG